MANRAFLAQRLRLFVNGGERIVIRKDKGRGGSSKKLNHKEVPPENVAEDIPWDWTITSGLYHESLCSFVPYNPIEIPATTIKKFPFQFTLPKDVLESYSGQNLRIEYHVTAVAERPWKRDRYACKTFSIFSPSKGQITRDNKDNGKKNNINMISNSSIDGHSTRNKTEEERGGKGHNKEKTISILNKQQQGQLAKIEFDINTFSPGDTIKGKLYLHTGNCKNNNINNKTSKIKSIEISLNAIDHVNTYNDDGLKRNEIYYKRDFKFEKYTKKFELNTDIKNIIFLKLEFQKMQRKVILEDFQNIIGRLMLSSI